MASRQEEERSGVDQYLTPTGVITDSDTPRPFEDFPKVNWLCKSTPPSVFPEVEKFPSIGVHFIPKDQYISEVYPTAQRSVCLRVRRRQCNRDCIFFVDEISAETFPSRNEDIYGNM